MSTKKNRIEGSLNVEYSNLKIKKNLAGTRSFYERRIKTIVAKPNLPVKYGG